MSTKPLIPIPCLVMPPIKLSIIPIVSSCPIISDDYYHNDKKRVKSNFVRRPCNTKVITQIINSAIAAIFILVTFNSTIIPSKLPNRYGK